MTAAILTGQQQAVAVLARILAVPGVAQASWHVYRDAEAAERAEISGQIAQGTVADVRAAINTYTVAFSWLDLDDEAHFAGDDSCEAFTSIGASGVIDGVTVRVWGAGR